MKKTTDKNCRRDTRIPDIAVKGLLALLVVFIVSLTGCLSLLPGDTATSQPFNFSPELTPVPVQTIPVKTIDPFKVIPDMQFEPVPGMVLNISSSNKTVSIGQKNGTQAASPPPSEKPLFTTFYPGDSASDRNTRITLDSVAFAGSFNLTPYGQAGSFDAPRQGYSLMLLNVTVQDLGDNGQLSESLFNGIVVNDRNGKRYSPGLSIVNEVKDKPGTSRGYLFYEIPESAPGLKMNYHFPDVIGVTATFVLQD